MMVKEEWNLEYNMSHDLLGDRMKAFESVGANKLLRKTPVIVRVDGKGFSKFCTRFTKPYDEFLNKTLCNVMKYICENVQGCKLAERHSDEMSFLLTDWDDINTGCYFDYKIQKMCSVVASMATAEFCRILYKEHGINIAQYSGDIDRALYKHDILNLNEHWPNFDARVFNLPLHEVSNYFYWRNLDATRNSINMLAQSKFSHRELNGVTNDMKQEMLFQKFGINWASLPQEQKTGFYCYKIPTIIPAVDTMEKTIRNKWTTVPACASVVEIRELINGIFADIGE